MRRRKAVAERLWTKFARDPNGCWQWTATIHAGGYARFYMDGKFHHAHRVAYELLVGPVPEGLVLDHLCRNRSCVNPSHLEPVTFQEKVLRGEGPTAMNARKDECVRGHDLTDPDNLYECNRNERRCRACTRERNAESKRKRRDALRAQGLNARGEPRKIPEAHAMWRYAQRANP